MEAQAIGADPERLEIPALSLDEPRYQVIGRIGQKTWSAFVTYRNDTIRIISVRRVRPEEEARYLAGKGFECRSSGRNARGWKRPLGASRSKKSYPSRARQGAGQRRLSA